MTKLKFIQICLFLFLSTFSSIFGFAYTFFYVTYKAMFGGFVGLYDYQSELFYLELILYSLHISFFFIIFIITLTLFTNLANFTIHIYRLLCLYIFVPTLKTVFIDLKCRCIPSYHPLHGIEDIDRIHRYMSFYLELNWLVASTCLCLSLLFAWRLELPRLTVRSF